MKFIAKIELLLVGMWLGAACFFSFGVAPSAFSVLPSSELAGNLVNRTLFIVNVVGLVIGLLVLGSSFLPRSFPGALWAWSRRLLLFVFAAACAVGQFGIGLRLAFLRLEMGKPVAELAADNPLKIQFDQLHQASVWVLMAGMAAALIAFFVMTKQGQAKEAVKPAGDTEFDFPLDLKI
jgi:hypothetical protein